jgi:hypothetical protein
MCENTDRIKENAKPGTEAFIALEVNKHTA